jgi:hypothetical protein
MCRDDSKDVLYKNGVVAKDALVWSDGYALRCVVMRV